MKKTFKTMQAKFLEAPRLIDVLILSLLCVLITWQPHFADREINIFEVGIYLPGIQAILDGEIPFEDFFHLRGPLELYMPAALMKGLGVHIKTLYTYFFAGNVLCLILCVLIGFELFKTRGMLYMLIPVLIGRTYPRVVYAYWGGMRYAFGLLTVWLAIKYFKSGKGYWMYIAGLAAACGLLTSVEMGIYPALGIVVALAVAWYVKMVTRDEALRSFENFLFGMATIGFPVILYLATFDASAPYINSVVTIVTNMQNVIDPHLVSEYPRNFSEALVAMTNLSHTNFKHMTPSYLYIFLLAFLVSKIRKKQITWRELSLFFFGTYGFVMYNTGFRGLWAAQFEMSLQPEKILYFYLLEVFLLMILAKKAKPVLVGTFCFILIGSSLGYAVQRYNHRFYAFKYLRNVLSGQDTGALHLLAKEETARLTFPRAKGVLVPVEQAEELQAVYAFVEEHIKPGEAFYTYPEMGTYHFLFDRPFVTQYPIATFAWFNDEWHHDMMNQLKHARPRYIFIQKEMEEGWDTVYLGIENNRKKYNEAITYIQSAYRVVKETPLSLVYQLKE